MIEEEQEGKEFEKAAERHPKHFQGEEQDGTEFESAAERHPKHFQGRDGKRGKSTEDDSC